MNNGVAIGIDGGASSLKWSVRDPAGRLHHGKTIGANQQSLDWPTYTARLTTAILEALTSAGAAPEEISSLGMGLSGVDRPDEQQRLWAWARSEYTTLTSCWIGNDALPALRQGAGRLSGLILIAGTGSICTGVGEGGVSVRAGGWGATLGDEGSGFWIGNNALNMVCQMADGRRRRTALVDGILGTLGLKEPMDLLAWIAGKGKDKYNREVAALAPVVLRLALEGDPGARRLHRQALSQLASLIFTAARRLDELEGRAAERTVVCAGGLFEHPVDLAGALGEAGGRRNPPLKMVRLNETASLGALHLGLEHPLEGRP